MRKKEMIAMLLAGGQGSRLGVLTTKKAKPVVAFGGKYRMIDFPMSNCINSGVDTVGVLTQYQPLQLNQHIGIGIPWDLDRKSGGVTVLSPHVKSGDVGDWYSGSANAIFQNMDYITSYNPEYVLVLSADHIYKMDYAAMLKFHKEHNCDVTIPVREVPWEEAPRFGILNADTDDRIYEFEEKPKNPKSNLASMGIYIFTWDKLREYLIRANKIYPDCDFGKHVITMMVNEQCTVYAYRFKDYWQDVGTIESYWSTNMELIKTLPDFNLYDDFSKIYTDSDHQPPQYTGADADVKASIVSEGCQIFGTVKNSVLGADVYVAEGATVRDSIIMNRSTVGANSVLDRCIVDENTEIGADVVIGTGDNIPNLDRPKIYDTGITVIGEDSSVPDGVVIGKNCVIYGRTKKSDYTDARLESGGTIIVKEGESL